MIKLDVKDYCQDDCSYFDAHVVTLWANNEANVFVRCRNGETCERLMNHLKRSEKLDEEHI